MITSPTRLPVARSSSPPPDLPGQAPGPHRRRRIWPRLVIGCVLVLLASATTAALFVLAEVHTLRSDLSVNPSLRVKVGSLAQASYGSAQTLLLVGDDQRALTKYYHHAVLPHANEMLLVRIDPAKPWISMMSIPRELQVTIRPKNAPAVTTRFNYAYTAGGIPLLLSTIKQVTGLDVNHVVVITFGRFRRAVDQMGCIYSTVDRRYYHVNVPGGEQYQEIDLQPGYQLLCGTQALQFVSYRHGDTSLVRDARDQSFLLDVKKQFGPELSGGVHHFEHIFGEAVQTDPSLHTTTGILDLIGTLINSSSRRVRQVHFQANLLPTVDTASPQQISASVHSFLYGGTAVPAHSTAATARAVHHHAAITRLPLAPVGPDELAAARALGRHVPFPLEYPRVRDRAGSLTPVFLRDYLIRGPDGTGYPSYVAATAAGGLGQFYDVQGTSWMNAPQFASPDQTLPLGSRRYALYYEGSKLRMIVWAEHGAVYWVRNSLLDSLPNDELLAIAEQTVPVTPGVIGHLAPAVKTAPTPLPGRAASVAASQSTLQTIGGIGGLVTLIALPALAFLLLRRRRELAAWRV